MGTTDSEPLAIYTNDTERMRILDNGQVTIDNGYTPPGSDNKFEVRADATHDDAVNGYSSAGYGVYGNSGSSYAVYGYSQGSTSVRAQNGDTGGTGLLATGNNIAGANISGGSGASIRGSKYGLYAKAMNTSDGTGVGSVGNGYATLSYLTTGSGGAFSGYHGVYGKGRDSSQGIGVIIPYNVDNSPCSGIAACEKTVSFLGSNPTAIHVANMSRLYAEISFVSR